MDWEQAFDTLPKAVLHTTHGNQKFYLSLGVDALTGNSDSMTACCESAHCEQTPVSVPGLLRVIPSPPPERIRR